jgi:dihydroxyacetone kinase
MAFGSRGAAEAAREAVGSGAGARTVLVRAGAAWAEAAGGTSGALWGAALTAAGNAHSDQDAGSARSTVDALDAGIDAVLRLGGAQVGDKTMVDALDPAVAALREALETGAPAAEALAAAEQAAVDAARTTAGSTARRGRASYVGDVAKGVIDPGAAAMALVIGASRAAVDGGAVDTAWIA